MRGLKIKLLLFFLCTKIIATGQTPALSDLSSFNRKTVLAESFDDNSNGWIIDNKYLSGRISNGTYRIRCNNFDGESGLTCIDADVDYSRDFEIETSIKILNGGGGLVFGMNDKYYHYRIEIDNTGNIYVVKQSNKLDNLYKIKNDRNIRPGNNNKITVASLNGIFYLYINDSFIREFNNIKPDGTYIGFNVGVKSDIAAEYLRVSYLDKEAGSLVADVRGSEPNLQNEELNKKQPLQATNMQDLMHSARTPEIIWTSPSAERTNISEYTTRVKASVKSVSKLAEVRFYVNDLAIGESEFQRKGGDSAIFLIDKVVSLKPGENSVYFLATNEKGESTRSPMRYFINPEASPPALSWVFPAGIISNVNTESIEIEGIVKSPSGITSSMILVNGIPLIEQNTFQASVNGEIRYRKSITLREGENSVYIIAANAAGRTQSDKRTIIYNKSLPEKRLALVIANSEYPNGVNLKNPVNDANLMEGTLKELGFTVLKSLNVGKAEMENAIREFSRQMANYNIALFFYAGHGIQVEGVNYLIPTDAKLENKDDCNWEAVAVNKVTDEFQKHETNTNIVILDACRNNPFRSWVRGSEQGFKAMGPVNGTIISYATSEGATAADGTGANGLFTEELVKQMMIPQQIENVFKGTRKTVMEKSKNQQIPVEWNYLTGDFYFKKQ